MSDQEKTSKTLAIDEASEEIREILKCTATDSGRTRIEEDRNLVAAIVPASNFEYLEEDDRQRRAAFAAMMKVSEAFMDVPIEESVRTIRKLRTQG